MKEGRISDGKKYYVKEEKITCRTKRSCEGRKD